MSDLEARKAAALAKKSAAEARISASESARAAEAEVAALERDASDAEALAAAVEKHGPQGTHVRVVPSLLGAIIVKRPTGAAFRKFQDSAKADSVAFEKLVRPCIVSPDAATVDRIFDEQPALLGMCADAVVQLAGARKEELAGK